MPDTDLNQFTVVQLKTWLSALGLQTSGSKAELMARLQTLSAEARGDPPIKTTTRLEQPPETDVDGAASLPLEQQLENAGALIDSDPMTSQPVNDIRMEQLSLVDVERAMLQKIRDEIEANKTVLQRIQSEIDDVTRNKTNLVQQLFHDVIDNSFEESGNPNDCAYSTTVNVNSNEANINRGIEIDKSSTGEDIENSVGQRQVSNVNKLLESPTTSLALAKEVTMDYDGNLCARSWVTQLQNIAQVYKLDTFGIRMLLIAKLKGKAQIWLHANATRILEPTDRLCEQLVLTFGAKMSKGELRNAFQSRQWRSGEKFATYFDEKIMLANDINIDKEELLENIIDGIPSTGLRDQARIQCFSEPMQMLKAFSGIHLPQRKQEANSSQRSSEKTTATKDFRCVNCNSKGHYAKDCRKPKREPGSCYACGKFGHFVGQCPERKSANTNKYHAS
ncbi:uncharacterized protein [Drosophila takahashii]|uniref:uncharacterized protein n=1 Tax=Drosophila takahashii TaxID=29030 RepID=UPI0038995B4B